MKLYEFAGDRGEILGHAAFTGRGQRALIDEQVADAAIADGFPLLAVTPIEPAEPEKEA